VTREFSFGTKDDLLRIQRYAKLEISKKNLSKMVEVATLLFGKYYKVIETNYNGFTHQTIEIYCHGVLESTCGINQIKPKGILWQECVPQQVVKVVL
jgi:hypothetical protein